MPLLIVMLAFGAMFPLASLFERNDHKMVVKAYKLDVTPGIQRSFKLPSGLTGSVTVMRADLANNVLELKLDTPTANPVTTDVLEFITESNKVFRAEIATFYNFKVTKNKSLYLVSVRWIIEKKNQSESIKQPVLYIYVEPR